jgi:hypothetical protein
MNIAKMILDAAERTQTDLLSTLDLTDAQFAALKEAAGLTTQAESVLESAGKPELGTMAVCVKCGQEVVFKIDFDDGPLSVNTLAWWALVDPDGDDDPFLCRPVGGAPLTMHSADPGVEQS